MRVLFSKTGSDGNATVIESSDGNLLCIDAGIHYNVVNRTIGYRLHLCRTLLLTHSHKDHSGQIKDFRNRGMLILSGQETCEKVCLKGVGAVFNEHGATMVAGFEIIPFPLIHTDSSGEPCECYGFLIRDTESKEKLLWCTDTAYIPFRFPPLDMYALEANFWEQTDYLDILDSIDKSVEIRRNKSHMSVETTVSFLQKQDLSKCKEIRLLHLSHSLTQAERDRLIPFIQSKIGRSDIQIVF